MDGNLQQFVTMHDHPDPSGGGVVCPSRLFNAAGSDPYFMPVAQYRNSIVEVVGLFTDHAAAEL